MSGILEWEYAAMLGLMAVVISAVTELVKRFIGIEPKVIAFAVSAVLQVAVQLVLADFSALGIFLGVVNIFAAALAAIGLHQTVIKPVINMILKGADNDA